MESELGHLFTDHEADELLGAEFASLISPASGETATPLHSADAVARATAVQPMQPASDGSINPRVPGKGWSGGVLLGLAP